ncbi:acyloxyacyl hydrolase [Thiomicrospira cyclica]|uniref:Lipid A 3-O-deacylase-related protein n=1 Tax=Thiomicrospira cyclica (strain DSM 14477 / JCM 11371 / ALM1) TaxID=717773 RepID=F6D9N6_THICA|nr:acyloxyacyl hydrolase [Thiomicrospira cyclica]AEG32085.1 Lipid A 3-O-deacylase-related protein [Thiomicrospira cyclica ALM1]
MKNRFLSHAKATLLLLPLTFAITLAPQAVKADEVGGALWRGATYATIAAVAYTNPFNADSFRFTTGAYPDHDAIQFEANLRYDLTETKHLFRAVTITPFLDVSYSAWQFSKDGLNLTNKGNVLGIAPGARIEWPTFLYVLDFIDVRAGVSILAPTQLENKDDTVRDFGGNFTFSEQFAMGGYFSEQKRWEWQVGIQHHSNHNIYEQNNGIEFYNITIGYNY